VSVWPTARTPHAPSGPICGAGESARSSRSRPTRSATADGEAVTAVCPPGFDREAYKQRNTVERCINRLRQWRGLATRTDKLAIAHQAALLTGILFWTQH
jgi:transposase